MTARTLIRKVFVPSPADSARAGYITALLSVAVLTAALTPLRTRLGLLTTDLLFLAVVVLVAARWGWGPGIVASLVANLAFNFFFVPPLYRFTVQEPRNALALLVFLFVAALTRWLLSRAQAGEAAALRREQETAILYDLSRLIIGEVNLPQTLQTICDRVREAFHARSCAVLLPSDGDLTPIAWSGEHDDGVTSADERTAAARAMESGETVALGERPGRPRARVVGVTGRGQPVVFVPLRVGGRSDGVLRVAGRLDPTIPARDQLRLLEAFADEAAPAVERDRLLGEAARVRALQEADELKSALLSAVSHDLRTPLTTILASASSLLQEDADWDAATRRQFLTQIEEQTIRLTRLVTNLLDLSRIEGGALRPDADWYDVGEFLEGVVAGLAHGTAAHAVRLTVADGAGIVRFDHVQMTQVVVNLVENAVKFSPDETEIRMAARRVGDVIEISVEDDGPGIPAGERERVFETFHRVAATSTKVRGSGLGLAIVRGLVRAHGGRVRAEEAAGGGARIVVTLPAPPPPRSILEEREADAV